MLSALIQWTNSIGAAVWAIVIHAFYSCCDVAYTIYLFEKVSSDHFLAVASFARTALLHGRFIKALLAIILNPNDISNSHSYLALIPQTPAFIIASIFLSFNRVQSPDSSVQSNSSGLLMKLQRAIPNRNGIFYSIWYIVGLGVFYQFVASEESFISNVRKVQYEVSMDFGTHMTVSNG